MCRRELVQLQEHLRELDSQGVRVWVISADGSDEAAAMAEAIPQFTFISDPDLTLINAFGVRHVGASPEGRDVAYPTHILVDGAGIIRDIWRAPRNTDRRSPDDLIAMLRDKLHAR